MPEHFIDASGEELSQEEKEFESVLRPNDFKDFTGQDKIVENFKVFLAAARQRNEALDHVFLNGPPGLGKTTLAFIIANELGVNIRVTSGPALEKPSDLAGLLTNLEEKDIPLFPHRHC